MQIETERKWLILRLGGLKLLNPERILQGYLSLDPQIRVRIKNNSASYLTIKLDSTVGLGGSKERPEFEWPIALEEARTLLLHPRGNLIEKLRYKIGPLEIDVFLRNLRGLVLIEWENCPVNAMLPAGVLAKDVSRDARFENGRLATVGLMPNEWRCEDAPARV